MDLVTPTKPGGSWSAPLPHSESPFPFTTTAWEGGLLGYQTQDSCRCSVDGGCQHEYNYRIDELKKQVSSLIWSLASNCRANATCLLCLAWFLKPLPTMVYLSNIFLPLKLSICQQALLAHSPCLGASFLLHQGGGCRADFSPSFSYPCPSHLSLLAPQVPDALSSLSLLGLLDWL